MLTEEFAMVDDWQIHANVPHYTELEVYFGVVHDRQSQRCDLL